MGNNITSQPYSQNLHCSRERGWGDNYRLGFWNEVLRKGTAATSRVSKASCVSGHSMVRGAGNFPDLFTPRLQACRVFSISTPCMESMFKMLSQHSACPQAIPWVFLFLLLCFQGFGTVAGVFFQHFVLPTALSLFHFQCSCEPCSSWLLSHVLLWIHTLSLIPSLGCLCCCSSGDRVIQFLGNSYYLSLWILPALP